MWFCTLLERDHVKKTKVLPILENCLIDHLKKRMSYSYYTVYIPFSSLKLFS